MQSAWRVVDCTNMEGQLSYVRGRMRVTVFSTGEIHDIPLSQVAVVLLGLKSNCSTALLHQLAVDGVSVLLCDWKNVPVGAMHSWSDTPTLVTQRHRAQVSMSVPRQKNAWKRIVQAKIRSQAHCLELMGIPDVAALLELAKQVKSGDTSNLEGQAARKYWMCLFNQSFHRMPGNGLGRNGLLDYGYAVLRGHVIRSIISAGLAPMFGVNHHNRSNYYCLADDLIEPFRPVIDYHVAQLDEAASLEDPAVKHMVVEAANAQFDMTGLTVPSALSDFAQQYGMYCEQKIDVLSVPHFEATYED